MNTRLIVLLFIVFLMAIVACKKTNDIPATQLITELNIINASNDSVNFYLNGTRLNSGSNLYPDVASTYINVLAGAQNYQIKKVFNPATSTVQQLFSIPLTLDTGKYYSLFIAGETAAQAFTTVDTLVAIPDTVSTCLVRFVNASPDGNSYNLVLNTSSAFTTRAFGTASGFQTVDTASFAPVALYKSGSTTPVVSGTFQLLLGQTYTIYTTGKLNGTGGSALGLAIMVN